ncbi:hypothetical protein FQR65_LT18324 [Abscondita terminalis]|nr:hypothetical protein FQR65_LT18324 [Abscondita terminalis]
MILLQDKDEPRRRLNSMAENENSFPLPEEIAPPISDVDIQDSENLEETQSEPLAQNVALGEQTLPPPPPKRSISKSTKRSRTNDEKLDKAFRILEASVSAPIQNEESEYQIFGRLVAKKLQGYTPDVRSIVQEELMKTLFKADRGFYNNLSNQQPPPIKYPVQTVSRQNVYNYPYLPTSNYNSNPNSNHPHHNSSNHHLTLSQTLSPAITSSPHHSSASNYHPNFFPNTPTASSSDDGSNEIYEI